MARQPNSRTHRKPRSSARDEKINVLIVTEGEETEKNYFNGLKENTSKQMQKFSRCCVKPSEKSNPDFVFNTALKEYKKQKGTHKEYNKVFCVFDKDDHPNFKSTIIKCNQQRHFEAITSDPCFELWILLHFYYVDKKYISCSQNSNAKQILNELIKIYPAYEKNKTCIFKELSDKLAFAVSNADRALNKHKTNPTEDISYTYVSTLINELLINKDN